MKHLAFASLAAASLALVSPAQQVLATFDFDDETLTAATSAAVTATDLSISNTFLYGGPSSDRWLCLTTDWNDVGGSISFTLTPNAGRIVDFSRLSWETVTGSPTSSDSVLSADVYVGGQLVATVGPLSDPSDALPGNNVVDLSGVPELQGVTTPTDFVIEFTGNPTGESSYEIGQLIVESGACVLNLADSDRIVWLPIPGCANHWRALDGAAFTENGDGTATLTGAIVNVDDPCKRLSMDVIFSDRVDPGDANYPPAGSPKTNAIVDGSGADTNTWRYYETFSGTFTGALCWQGAVLTIDRMGEAAQIGEAANLKDTSFGASAWFNVVITSQPTTGETIADFDRGDFNLTLGDDCICLGGVVATSSNYGEGIAGCDGVPELRMLNRPLTGSEPEIFVGNEGTEPRVGAIFWSMSPAEIFVPIVGGNLLVSLPPLAVQPIDLQPGGFVFSCEILDDACQADARVYLQALCIDPCAPQMIATSRGLEIIIGDL